MVWFTEEVGFAKYFGECPDNLGPNDLRTNVSTIHPGFFFFRRSPDPPNQQQPQALPRTASRPSRKMRGTIARAAIGSAHLKCQIALIPRPTMATKAR